MNDEMIDLDGSEGEGGGQILRSALGLSMVTGRPFRMKNIRAGRSKPGLLRQHLTCVTAAAEICGAAVDGAELGSLQLRFTPGPVKGGSYRFSIGSAGSCGLVIQAVLPALLVCGQETEITVEGGTHNSGAPSADFLTASFLPLLTQMGMKLEMKLSRFGFYPAGGGQIMLRVKPAESWRPLSLTRPLQGQCALTAYGSALPQSILDSELKALAGRLGVGQSSGKAVIVPSAGPGNALLAEYACEGYSVVHTGFGERGKPVGKVVDEVAGPAQRLMASGAAVCEHLQDQLLIPMALARGGVFRTVRPSGHTLTNTGVIRKFLDVCIDMNEISGDLYEIRVQPQGGNK